jgi:hypothetical protein
VCLFSVILICIGSLLRVIQAPVDGVPKLCTYLLPVYLLHIYIFRLYIRLFLECTANLLLIYLFAKIIFT